jgi:hypothetical protein
MEGIKPAFAPVEVLEDFSRYGKTFDDIFAAR